MLSQVFGSYVTSAETRKVASEAAESGDASAGSGKVEAKQCPSETTLFHTCARVR